MSDFEGSMAKDSTVPLEVQLDGGFTVVLALAVLFNRLASVSFSETEAEFTNVPGAVGTTRMVIVAPAPLRTVPKLHEIVAKPEQMPWEAVADTNITPAGKVSVRVTPVA
jgi:hypothetical protein